MNWKEQLGKTKLSKPDVYKGLLLNYGIIWNRYEYKCGGGGGNRTRATKIAINI